ncbi:hypothetical protein [Bifidobacterium tibiigranuli]|jgi:hypothetical protein|uniref:hypothetical protein n=1 Tax=Bifidobacterium tibiigranuli TaxID=2172043 RepID=UPI0023527CA0|nr:hypothetical protein [Bifidobacterium tibiigranuli]MCH3973705.1 hypothetical protein [Bifidobacterium tibiigranuli]
MAKPSERNKRMRELADNAVDDELAALKRKKESLQHLGVLLDDIRWSIERFRTESTKFMHEQDSSKTYLTKSLKIDPREASHIWPSSPRKPQTQQPDESAERFPTGNGDEHHEYSAPPIQSVVAE